ncbi:unnamed protein product [Calypogeia fissa]
MKFLAIESEELNMLPDNIGLLATLRDLTIHSNELEMLPEDFGCLESVQSVSLRLPKLERFPDSFGSLKTVRNVTLDCPKLERLPESFVGLSSLALELGPLPYVKALPAWLGKRIITPVALSHKIFRIYEAKFSLAGEEPPWWAQVSSSFEGRSERLFWMLYESAMEKVSALDYERALAILYLDKSGLKLRPWLQGFVLQEKGIIKRKMGNFAGVLRDLTASLVIFSEANDLRCYAYNCWRHRGFVNFLLGNFDEANRDGEMALMFLPEYCRYPSDFKGEKLGEESVTYMHFTLKGRREFEETRRVSRSQVMDMVRKADFSGAMAAWDALGGGRVPGYDPVFFLQERGILKRLSNDWHGALQDLTAALEIDPNDYECPKHRGYVKFL